MRATAPHADCCCISVAALSLGGTPCGHVALEVVEAGSGDGGGELVDGALPAQRQPGDNAGGQVLVELGSTVLERGCEDLCAPDHCLGVWTCVEPGLGRAQDEVMLAVRGD